VAYDTVTRRSELTALNIEDLKVAEAGDGTVLIRKSKVDQTGEGATLYLAADTVANLKAWIEASGKTLGLLRFDRGGGPSIGFSDVVHDLAVD